MSRSHSSLFVLLVVFVSGAAIAQPWSGILAPVRAIDWSQAGAGAIPDRTAACSSQPNLLTGSGNAGANRTALLNAWNAAKGGSGCVINIPAGTYYLTAFSSPLSHAGAANVTFRGAGPDQTRLIWTTAGSGGDWEFSNGGSDWAGGPSNVATWTAGYSKGTTTITLSSVTTGNINNLRTGSILILDQLDDASDTGNIYSCGTWGVNVSSNCAIYQTTGFTRSDRGQFQNVVVQSCVGANGQTCSSGSATAPYRVTITPGLYSPNWRSGQNPGAWWSSALPISGVGIENITLDYSQGGGSEAGLRFKNASRCWVKNVRSVNATGTGQSVKKHILTETSNHLTVRDSYFYGSNPAREGYAFDSAYESADMLFENNICQHLASCIIPETDTGSVYGYNYKVDTYYNAWGAWQTADFDSHHQADTFALIEGHEGSIVQHDSMLGTTWMNTTFRSYLNGRDVTMSGGQAKTAATFAYSAMYGSRYHNVVGSVLGTQSYHTRYEYAAPSATNCGDGGVAAVSVFMLGWSDQGGSRYANSCGSGAGAANDIYNDTLAASTLMRWGNYAACSGDAACNAVRWQSSEDASAAPTYPGLASPNTNLPDSFYLTSKPSWWGSMPWPAVGPDVSGGDIASVGGHAYHNPAANCYLNIMGGRTDGSSGLLAFNADTCYGGGPDAPSGLAATVH